MTTLSLSAGTAGAYVSEANAVTIDRLTVAVNRVGSDASVPASASGTATVTQEDMSSTGNLVLVNTTGDLTVNAGTAASNGVTAAGNLLLQASAGAITVNAAIANSSGHTSLSAGGSIAQNANITASGAASTVELVAGSAITMAAGTSIGSSNGNVLLNAAGGDITVETITAGTANVAITASGSIVDLDTNAAVDVTAAGLILNAGSGIGSGSNALETTVTTLSLSAGTAGAYVSEANAVTIDRLTVAVNRVGSDASVPASASGTATVTQEDMSSTGNLVLVNTTGDLTVNAGTAASNGVTAAGNLLLQASAGAITVNAAIVNSAGHTSLSAGGSIAQNANITASGAASTVELVAGSAITMGAGASLNTQNGNAVLSAANGSVTVEAINAGTANVAITASGSIIDLDTNGAVDITAAGVILIAGGSIGSVGNALETAVDAVAASSAADGIFLSEANDIAVTAVSLAVNLVNSQGGAALQAVLALSDLSTTGGNGSIELISQAGSITLNDGTPVNGAAVSANGSGTVQIKALGAGSDTTVNAKVISGSGSVAVYATDIVTMSSVIETTGEVRVDSGPTGKVVFSKPASQAGTNQDINVVANTVEITTPLASDGGFLVVSPLQPATGSSPVALVVGGNTPVTGLHLDLTEIGLIQDGFTDITLGSGLANQAIVINGVPGTVAFKDPLIINTTGVNNTLAVSGGLTGDTLTIQGSVTNTTTTLTTANISMAGNILVNGLIKVGAGDSQITAGNNATDGVTASLQIAGNIVGSTATGENLVLKSESNVVFAGTVSGIDALTVNAVGNVTFNETVSMTGNLVINASGAVRFDKSLTLTQGGTLTINGATSVVFASGAAVTVDGNLTIDAESLSLLGGANSLSSTAPNSTLTLTSKTSSNNIMIGSTVGRELAGALNLTTRDIEAIGTNFGKVLIGKAGLGVVTIAGNTDLTSVVGSSIEVLGYTITVQGGSGGTVQVPGALTLKASGDVVLGSGINAAKAAGITLTSSSSNITMAQGTRIDSRGGDVQINAVNASAVSIATINARSGDLSQRGIVDINAGRATISDANRDTAADIFAKAINMSGYGPSATGNGNVLEAVADLVRIDVPSGSVVRHSGIDGRTYYDVVKAGQLYQQVVLIGNATRVTENPNTLLQKGDAALVAAGVPATSSLLTAPISIQSTASTASTASMVAQGSPLTVSTAASRYLASITTGAVLQGDVTLDGVDLGAAGNDDLLSDSSYGLASRLQQSYVVGTPGAQPLISGLDTFSQDNFEYWVDTLAV